MSEQNFLNKLPEKLLTKDGLKLTKTLLENKTKVALFFGAQYCGYCKEFSPKLSKFYHRLTQLYDDDSGIEIIFVSRDKDEESFNEYFNTMDWAAIPFEQKTILDNFYKPKTIPCLLIVDIKTSKINATDGREKIIDVYDEDIIYNLLNSWC